MNASYVALHFVFFLFFFILQFLYYEQSRTDIQSAFSDIVLIHQQLRHDFISDQTRFQIMSTDGKLVLDPFPTEPLEFGLWFENQSRKANECTLKVKNDADKTETVSFLAIFLLAWRWNPKTEIWSAADADITKLTAAAIIQEATLLTDGEKSFLREDEALSHFTNARTHRQMQVTFRAAIKRAVEGHRLYGDLCIFDKSIDMHDLYQGSRLLQHFLELVSTSMRRMKVTLLPACLRLADELLENPDLPKAEIHAVVARLGKCADALVFSGYLQGDTELASHFIDALKAHPRPKVVAAVNAAEKDGAHPTVAEIRLAVLKHIPLSAEDHSDVQAHVSHVPPLLGGSTLLDRTCAALLSMLPHKTQQPSSRPVHDGGAPKVCRTLEEQQAYIKQIWNQHHQNYRDPGWLADKLKKAQAAGSGTAGGRGRGRGQSPHRGGYSRVRGDVGGGRGRGAPVPPQADKAEVDADPEAFCAHMNLEISHDLQTERLLRPDPVSTPEPHDDTDSADEDCPVPSVEPPVFPHPE